MTKEEWMATAILMLNHKSCDLQPRPGYYWEGMRKREIDFLWMVREVDGIIMARRVALDYYNEGDVTRRDQEACRNDRGWIDCLSRRGKKGSYE